MFRGKKKAVRILAGILAGVVIGSTTAAAANTPEKPCAEITARTRTAFFFPLNIIHSSIS